MSKKTQTLLLLLAAAILAAGAVSRLYFASKAHPPAPDQAPAQEPKTAPAR